MNNTKWIRSNRQITINGDTPLVAQGTPLFYRKANRTFYNVSPGEPIAFLASLEGEIPTAIDETDLNSSNVHRLRLAVGHSTRKDGLADSLRYLGVEGAGNCDLEDVQVDSPRCGNPPVFDFYGNCFSCDETYTINAAVRNNFTESHTKARVDYAYFQGSYKPNCKTCEGCDSDVDIDAIADGLIESVMQAQPLTLNGLPYPDWIEPTLEKPFGMHRLYNVANSSKTYCLSYNAPASDCVGCNQLESFTRAVVGSVDIDLSDLVTPADNTAIFRAQLRTMAAFINQAFADDATVDGHAYVTGVTANSCCPMQLHVSTNDPTFAIHDSADAAITPVNEYNPFDTGQDGEGYTLGLRIIGAEITGDCSCVIDKPLASYMSNVKIEGVEWPGDTPKQVLKQKTEHPAGFGTLVQYDEYSQDVGGEGRSYSRGYQGETSFGGLRSGSRAAEATTADCNKDYCRYYIRSIFHGPNIQGRDEHVRINSWINVESDATAANTSIKALLDAWVPLATSCQDPVNTTCTPLSTTC